MEAKSNTMASGMTRNIERVGDRAHKVVDRATDAATSAAERIGEHVDTLAEKRDELMELPETWMESARDYVRDNPLASIGIALAAGYLLHMITRRR
jgi:ElaB/YqjD/DUF883 family membrane-anchored ribosome-binding protein